MELVNGDSVLRNIKSASFPAALTKKEKKFKD